jgi:hypothetical protein
MAGPQVTRRTQLMNLLQLPRLYQILMPCICSSILWMRMHAFMPVLMYVHAARRMHACIHPHVDECACACDPCTHHASNACVHGFMHVWMCMRLSMLRILHMQNMRAHACMHALMHVWMCMCHAFAPGCMHACMHSMHRWADVPCAYVCCMHTMHASDACLGCMHVRVYVCMHMQPYACVHSNGMHALMPICVSHAYHADAADACIHSSARVDVCVRSMQAYVPGCTAS